MPTIFMIVYKMKKKEKKENLKWHLQIIFLVPPTVQSEKLFINYNPW